MREVSPGSQRIFKYAAETVGSVRFNDPFGSTNARNPPS
jgi:hypothetical protein